MKQYITLLFSVWTIIHTSDVLCQNLYTEVNNINTQGEYDSSLPFKEETDHNADCKEYIFNYENFKNGWGIWNSQGVDAQLTKTNFFNIKNNTASIILRSKGMASMVESDRLALQSFQELTIDFSFYSKGLDKSNEGFDLEISYDAGYSYHSIKSWTLREDFENLEQTFDVVQIRGPFSNQTMLRFVGHSDSKYSCIYIDDIEISGCSTAEIKATEVLSVQKNKNFLSSVLYPNPASQSVRLDIDSPIDQEIMIHINSIYNNKIKSYAINLHKGQQSIKLNIEDLPSELYTLVVRSREGINSQRLFVHNP